MPFLHDTFTAADDTALQNHTPDVGTAPDRMEFVVNAHVEGVPTTDGVIRSNRFVGNTANTSDTPMYRYPDDPGADEYDLEFATEASSTGAGRYLSVMVRASPTGVSYGGVDRYVVGIDGNSEIFELWKVVGGVATLLDDDAYASETWPQDVTIEVRDGSLRVLISDVERLATADTDITQRGRVGAGIRRGATGVNWVDDLVATALGEPGDEEDLDETIEVSEILTDNLESAESSAEATEIAEVLEENLDSAEALAESVGVSDTLIEEVESPTEASEEQTEAIGISEVLTENLETTESQEESITVGDTLEVSQAVDELIAESIHLAESLDEESEAAVIDEFISEICAVTDEPTSQLEVGETLLEDLGILDSLELDIFIVGEGLIISMLQVHTQVRSMRIGRPNQLSEEYSNQGFSRSGGGTQDGDG